MSYPGQMSTSQGYGSSGPYAPVTGGAAAGQGYPSMSQSAYGGAPFNFQSNQYTAGGYNPYSQGYGLQPQSYRPQPQSGEPQAFMSPFTSPAGQVQGQQFKQEPGQQQQQQQQQHQQQQQQQYGSQVQSSYAYPSSAYPSYATSSTYQPSSAPGGAAPSQQAHAHAQPQQPSSSYGYYGQPGGAAPQYGAHSGTASRGAMSNPASTPHLPPIQRPGENDSGAPGVPVTSSGADPSYGAR